MARQLRRKKMEHDDPLVFFKNKQAEENDAEEARVAAFKGGTPTADIKPVRRFTPSQRPLSPR